MMQVKKYEIFNIVHFTIRPNAQKKLLHKLQNALLGYWEYKHTICPTIQKKQSISKISGNRKGISYYQ